MERPDTPVFYSALTRAIETARGAPRQASAEQWRQWLDGAQRRGELRRSERDWVGVDAWLDGHDELISREALVEFVRANEVQVQDGVLGAGVASDSGPGTDTMTREQLDDLYEQEVGYRPSEDDPSMSLEDLRELVRSTLTMPERQPAGAVRYSGYRTPGGENYRELLLTLPRTAAEASSRGWQDYRDDLHARGLTISEADEVRRWGVGAPANSVDQNAVARARSTMGDAWMQAYRDVLQKRERRPVKDVERVYRSNHWDQPNVLAHVRFDERTDADGQRVLFLQEIQSDWHQQGRRSGYQRTEALTDADVRAAADVSEGFWNSLSQRERDQMRRELEQSGVAGGVPDAPFKQSDEWAMLAFKRMARWAVDNGFDRIAWTTGSQAAALFDLSTHIETVGYRRHGESDVYQLAVWDKDGKRVLNKERAALPEVETLIGKELAQKVANGNGRREDGFMYLEGMDLRVGGEGMRGFYDRILPAAVNKWGKKFGAHVGETRLPPIMKNGSPALMPGAKGLVAHAIDITPQMREAVIAGMPLFRREGTMAQAEFLRWFEGSQVVRDDGAPLAVYHGTAAQFIEFKVGYEGGIFFSAGRAHAEAFARNRSYGRNTGAVHEVYLALRNPLVISQDDLDARHDELDEDEQEVVPPRVFVSDFIEEAKAAGHDGLIVRGMADLEFSEDVYVAFRPEQIVHTRDVEAAHLVTATPEFRRWFGGSQVVDGAGRPAVVYHGTTRDFEAFERRALGQSTRNPSAHLGFFFNSDPDEAAVFAINFDQAGRAGADGAKLLPVYLAINKPYELSAAAFTELTIRQATPVSRVKELRAALEAEGYDGVLVRADDEAELEELQSGDTWIAFHAEQIKSAVGNAGTFDPENPSIAHRRAAEPAKREGLSVEEVDQVVQEFVRQFNGKLGLAIRVALSQEEAFGPQATPQRLGTIKAAVDRGQLTLVASNHRDRNDVLASLQHEVLGHYGLGVLGKDGRQAVIERIVEGRHSKGLGALWSRVERHYRQMPGDPRPRTLDEKAEEVFCHAAEHVRPSKLGRAWTRVLAATTRGLRKIGLVDDAITVAEMQDLALSIARGIRRGRQPEHVHEAFAMSRRGGGFYSALTAAIDSAQGAPRQARAEQWIQWLDGAQRRGEFKRAEREWVGLDTWLREQSGPVPREALARYAREHEVQLHEVVLGTRDRRQQMRERADAYADYRAGKITRSAWEDRIRMIDGDARFAQYQLPGGERYRELLVMLPSDAPPKLDLKAFERKVAAERGWASPITPEQETEVARAWRAYDDERAKQVFRTAHWPEHENVLLHVRFNERTTLDGTRTLLVEELQSDLHQQGRRRGYGPQDGWRVLDENGQLLARQPTKALADAIAENYRAGRTPLQMLHGMPGAAATVEPVFGDVMGVLDAPFKRSEEWALLGVKRIVQWAVENGFHQIAWTSGKQQAERYDLRHHVREIAVFRHPEGDAFDVSVQDINGRRHDTATRVREDALERHIGKDLAEKAREQPPRAWKTYEGLDLSVGGEAMAAFYDTIVTNAVARWAKGFGGEVTRATLADGERKFGVIGDPPQVWDLENDSVLPTPYSSWEEAERAGLAMEPGSVHALRITPAMREAVLDGLPLFRREDELQLGSPEFRQWFGASVITVDGKPGGDPLAVYHGTDQDFAAFDADYGNDIGFHFGSVVQASSRAARAGGNVMPVYLTVTNPLRLPDMQRWNLDTLREVLAERGISVEVPVYEPTSADVYDNLLRHERAKNAAAVRAITAAGYDGIVYRNGVEGEGDSYVVFSPEQIKSATANRGSYDPGNPDIRFRREVDAQQATPEFKRWFGASKVVQDDGAPRVVYHGTPVFPLDDGRALGDVEAFNRRAVVELIGRRPRLDTVGSWFSTRPDEKGAGMYASTTGVIYPVYLAIENPYTTTFAMMVRRAHMLAGTWDSGGYDDAGRRTHKVGSFTTTVNASADIGEAQVEALRAWLKAMGRDGIRIVRDPQRPGGEFEHQDAWIALEPEQVKSAIGNSGHFDPANPDIRFRREIDDASGDRLRVVVDTASAAFEDAGRQAELARVVRAAALAVETGQPLPITLRDTNGNAVGWVGEGVGVQGDVQIEVATSGPAAAVAARLRGVAELVEIELPSAAELEDGSGVVATMRAARPRAVEATPGVTCEPA